MKKNNEELKHKKNEKLLSKKNYIIIIVPIVLIIILIVIIAIYVFAISSQDTKLKKYLENQNYTCNKETCSIYVNNTTEDIDLKTGILTVSNVDYSYIINHNYITYQDNIKELTCTYRNQKYEFYSFIDTTFTANTSCEVYIESINESINKYLEIFEKANIDVNQFKK